MTDPQPPLLPRDPIRVLLPWIDAPAPVTPTQPTAEERRAKAAAAAAEKLRAKASRVQAAARRWAFAVILISTVITVFGSGNAHAVFLRHDTTDPWAWLPYPALEAALIVEIQIGGELAEHKLKVRLWGDALRLVTAIAAVTVCVYGPAETGDWGGAGLHALGPVVQFFLAEFLARARAQFKAASEALLARADGRESAGRVTDDARTDKPGKRTGKPSSASRPRPDERTTAADSATSASADQSAPVDDDDLLVRAHAAADELARTDQRLNRDNLVRVIRAGGGTIQNKDAGRLLAQVRAERGGPDLHPVHQKGA